MIEVIDVVKLVVDERLARKKECIPSHSMRRDRGSTRLFLRAVV